MNPFRAQVDAICGALPGAALPGAALSGLRGDGHDASTVGGKMFAGIGATLPGPSVRTPDGATASTPIDAGVSRRTPAFHRALVRLGEDRAADEPGRRLVTSDHVVRFGLPKRVQTFPAQRETA